MALTLPDLSQSKEVGSALTRWRDLLERALRLPPASERGRLLTVVVSASPVSVAHGLGAVPAGWLVLRSQGAAPVSVTETASDARTLTLLASGAATLTLWVWP